MPYLPMITLECDCGHILMLFQSEHKQSAEIMAERMREEPNITIVIAEGQVYQCPACNKPHEIPAGEELDADRTPWGKFLSDMVDRLEREQYPRCEPK